MGSKYLNLNIEILCGGKAYNIETYYPLIILLHYVRRENLEITSGFSQKIDNIINRKYFLKEVLI